MPKPYKLYSARPLPSDAELVDLDGRRHVRVRERGKPVLYSVSKDGTKYLRPSKRWYFDCRDAHGTVRRKKGFTDLEATRQLAAEMERKVARIRAGIIDPAEEHMRRPLTEHLQDYAAHLEAKGNCAAHNEGTIAQIAALLSGCGAVFLADVDPGKAAAWLNDLRRDAPLVALPVGVDAFTPSEAARILGWTRCAGPWRTTG